MTTAPGLPTRTDVLVVGAGPAGSAAAAWMARFGHDVVLADAAVFPRDKTCGDGLTPRAVAELDRLGLTDWLRGFGTNRGLRAAGFGQELLLPWPGGSLPDWGSAVPRTTLDARIRRTALDDGALPIEGARAVDVVRDPDGRVTGVVFAIGPQKTPHTIDCRQLIVADGVRSTLGRVLGREWHRDTAYGVAGRSYVKSERSDDPWISSHLELRGPSTSGPDTLLPGYGWIFPLSDGEVNLGVGALATAKRPADLQIRPLMEHYAHLRRDEWGLGPDLRMPTSALLPMGGAVSGVAGPNWILIGDAAGCVNPLNGEGIDYGLETGRVGAELLDEATKVGLDVERAWPQLLTSHYGEAFSIARRIAGVFTVPGLLPKAGPIGMRSYGLMTVALRVMGNFITDEDRDTTARLWRWAGRRSVKLDHRPPWS
jgi:geranylgeranyl reductase family protein